MEEIDMQIIRELEKGEKLEDISKKLKISIATIRNHMNKLEEKKIIVDKRYRLRYKLMGMQEIILGLDVKPDYLIDAISSLKGMKNVRELYRTSGDHVLIAVLIGKDEELKKDMEKIMGMQGVNRLFPAFVEEIEK
ncbi:MAG: Lrp/AsnC family transcriptional regulator [Candidatus Micrarchaeia archaeon]